MTVGPYTQQLLDAHAPWLADDVSGDLRGYLIARGAMGDPVATIVSDVGFPDDPGYVPGWSVLLDPDNCPTQFLPWLGMFLGVSVPPGTSDADGRALIRQHAGFSRGTVQSFRSAIERAQATPDPSRYAIQERTGVGGPDAYHFLIDIDLSSLRTAGDPTQLVANVNAVKPAGLQFTVISLQAPLLSQYTRLLSAVTVPLNAANLSDVI